MKLTLTSRGQNIIRAYAAGEVRIGEQTLHDNCVIAADNIVEWSVQDVASLSVADLAPIFALNPEVVVLGTGERQQFPPPAIHAAFMAREIGFEVMDLGAACRTFNILLSEDRRVVAALLLR